MKYAIVESGGKQFKAVEGGIIEVDRLQVESGTSIQLKEVLLLVDGDVITVGKPHLSDNPVWTKVVGHFKGPKVTIFNYSPKKRIRVKTGHRQAYTRLLVEQVGGLELVHQEAAKVEKAVKNKAETSEVRAKVEKAKSQSAAKPKPVATSTKSRKPSAETSKKPASKPATAKPVTTKKSTQKPAVKTPATKAKSTSRKSTSK